ncbi:unnamed protein product [Thelazia callipaeda]|uniref:DBF4-type domain-containing protein n=1 Tax=Thelazia callipaeda TaxID=103827 RepID=A0A0N5D0Y6_THECL|nr:unnamed protein product [Thelazia callipaeda]
MDGDDQLLDITDNGRASTNGSHNQRSTSLSFFSDSFILKHGQKPLCTLSFVLDFENETIRMQLEKDLKLLGAKVLETFDPDRNKKPSCVITDHPYARYLEKVTRAENPTVKNINSLPVLLRAAIRSGVRIRSSNSFVLIISNVKNRLKIIDRMKMTPMITKREVSIRLLKAPFIKLENNSQCYMPYWKEFSSNSNFRPIYIGQTAGKSIFHRASLDVGKRKKEKSNVKIRARSRVGNGFCDICTRSCRDLQSEHLTHIRSPGFYDEVDALCGSFVNEIKVPKKKSRKHSTREVSTSKRSSGVSERQP